MSRTLMVNNEKALSTAFSKLHDKADLVRVLEKSIVDDYLAGFSTTQMSKRNGCTCKRVKRVIGCYESNIEVKQEESNENLGSNEGTDRTQDKDI